MLNVETGETIAPATVTMLEHAYPQDRLRWAYESFGKNLAVVTSFQPTGIVTLHMMNTLGIHPTVMTLDTGLLFPESYTLINDIEKTLDINLMRVRPSLTVDEQADQFGEKLWARDPDACCRMRKTVPLARALKGYKAWMTGLRRDQSTGRAKTPVITWDAQKDMFKLCPFADWTEEMIWTYIYAHDLPYNTLHDRGYPSIGCLTCTHAVASGDDARSGRWVGHDKTECGIHVPSVNNELNA